MDMANSYTDNLAGQSAQCHQGLIIVNNDRSKPKHLRKSFTRIAAVVTIILIGVSAATYFKVKSLNTVYSATNGWTSENVSWRAHLFARKARGNVSDLSWRELWFMIRTPGGFRLKAFV